MKHPSSKTFHSIFFLASSAIIIDRSNAFVLPINNNRSQYHQIAPSSSSSTTTTTLRYKNEGGEESEEPVENSNSNSEKQDMVAMNVLGTALRPCCNENGDYCNLFRLFDNPEVYDENEESDPMQLEEETVCCQVTPQFLNYVKLTLGKDLQKPRHNDGGNSHSHPGLKAGDIGCITVEEWTDAYNEGCAPYLFLESTHSATLDYIPCLDFLQVFAIDLQKANQRLQDLNTQRNNLEDLL